ncbi:hypothetical protein CXB51_003806 [Gossypium anomalum]|uniref:Integrase catalytic domain-containing protein n=1 Tax=Gossypium anomalum TaxID=47600 RepID=A0A8J5Z687_9ROSI|nr:hypothetical protein CXB51_003806 [Gossypium anomalum]
MEEHQEGAFQAKAASINSAYKNKKNWKNRPKPDAARGGDRLCRFCKRPGHPEVRCWFRPDAVCQHCKKKGHVERLAKRKVQKAGCWTVAAPITCHQMQPFLKPWIDPAKPGNLLSISQLLGKGYSIVFKGQECQITDPNGSSLMTVTMSDKCFEVNWSDDSHSAHVASTEDTKLWHQRLGNANFKSMARMVSKEMVENFTKIVQNEEVCEVCQMGKQARLPFPTNTIWRASSKLELVHTDVCGRMRTESLSGNRYFILFIDDCTRYCWIFFLKHKSEVVQVFMKFKAAVETEIGCKIKTIRLDNGTEYTSAQFQAFCKDTGIKHQLTNVYTPQQNGVSERKNRSLMDMARCLLFEKNLPKTMWAEAVNTVVYIQNRLPIKALAHKTPFEAWFGFKPSLAHMKVFGCLCYNQVPAVKRDKLSKRAVPGILTGYSMVKKGYRILDPLTNKIQTEPDENGPEMDVDDEPVKGTRTLVDIYERAHVAQEEPSSFEEAEAHQG